MKKRKHIGLWILLAMLIVFGTLAFLQRENISAAIRGIQVSPEELEQQLVENEQRVRQAVESSAVITVRDLTDEEKAALKDGTQSREEIIKKLTEPQEKVGDDSDTTSKYAKDLSALIAEVYVMQAEYNAALEDMIEQAKEEYSAKSKDEKTKTALIKWANSYVSRATALEKECDAKMDDITARLLALIKENNGDTSLADEVVYAYANEKSLKKSWYLSEMQKRGLLG